MGIREARDSAGCIVSFVHRTTGERRSVHRSGFLRDALPQALEGWDSTEWRVSAISTPRTILADLSGRVQNITYRTRGGKAERHWVELPELRLLAHRKEFL